jgi:hypothetical protein
VGFNPTGGIDVGLVQCLCMSGRGLCGGPIPRPEESYRLWRVLECDQVITSDLITSDHGRRGKNCDTELKKGQVKKYEYFLIDYLVV